MRGDRDEGTRGCAWGEGGGEKQSSGGAKNEERQAAGRLHEAGRGGDERDAEQVNGRTGPRDGAGRAKTAHVGVGTRRKNQYGQRGTEPGWQEHGSSETGRCKPRNAGKRLLERRRAAARVEAERVEQRKKGGRVEKEKKNSEKVERDQNGV